MIQSIELMEDSGHPPIQPMCREFTQNSQAVAYQYPKKLLYIISKRTGPLIIIKFLLQGRGLRSSLEKKNFHMQPLNISVNLRCITP